MAEDITERNALRIIVADDHDMIREGLKSILSKQYDLDVVGEATDGEAALELIRRNEVDLVFLDLSMPGMRGLDVISAVREDPAVAATRFIVLTMHSERSLFKKALRRKVNGYLLKVDTIRYLNRAVEAVLGGNSFYSPELEKIIFEDYAEMQIGDGPLEMFTSRELSIIKLIAAGLTSSQIAAEICISKRTVEFHRGNINKKLNTNRVSEITRYALKNGLV